MPLWPATYVLTDFAGSGKVKNRGRSGCGIEPTTQSAIGKKVRRVLTLARIEVSEDQRVPPATPLPKEVCVFSNTSSFNNFSVVGAKDKYSVPPIIPVMTTPRRNENMRITINERNRMDVIEFYLTVQASIALLATSKKRLPSTIESPACAIRGSTVPPAIEMLRLSR